MSLFGECCGFENLIFDFEQFLRSYSEVLYPLFLWHIYSIKYRLQGFDTSAFLSIINSSYEGVPFCDVANNSSAVLYKLKTLCTATIMELKDSYPNVCLGPVEGELISLGVTPQNVYLFIRGHNLQPLVQAIGKEVIDEILRTEKAKLNNDLEKIRELYVAPGQPHQKSVQY